MRKWHLLLAVPLLLSAAPPAHVARIGQTISVEGPRVRPLHIIEDSRCPIGVYCVWSGRVRVLVRIIGGKTAFNREMEQGKPIPVFDGELVLSDVKPDRRSTVQTKPSAYRFSFTFSGGL